MAKYEVVKNGEHFVVSIKVERVATETIFEPSYNRVAEGTKANRVVEEVSHLVIKNDTLDKVLNSAINHISLMKDDK